MVYNGYYKVMSNIPKMDSYQPLKIMFNPQKTTTFSFLLSGLSGWALGLLVFRVRFSSLLGLFHDALHPEVQSSHTLVHDGGFLSKMMVEKWDFYWGLLNLYGICLGFRWFFMDLKGISWEFMQI